MNKLRLPVSLILILFSHTLWAANDPYIDFNGAKLRLNMELTESTRLLRKYRMNLVDTNSALPKGYKFFNIKRDGSPYMEGSVLSKNSVLREITKEIGVQDDNAGDLVNSLFHTLRNTISSGGNRADIYISEKSGMSDDQKHIYLIVGFYQIKVSEHKIRLNNGGFYSTVSIEKSLRNIDYPLK